MAKQQSIYDKARHFFDAYEGFEAGYVSLADGNVERDHATASTAAGELVALLLGDHGLQLCAAEISQAISEYASLS